MKNINPYNPLQFKKEWENSDIYKKLCRDFDVVLWDFPGGPPKEDPDWTTPRWGEINRVVRTTPFYYIEKVMTPGAEIVNDLGCGCNVFKRYYPNIIGMDNCRFADVQGYVDDKFIAENQNKCEAIIAINSLHFRPLTEFKKSVLDIISILKPGGRAYLAYNAVRFYHESIDKGEIEKLFNKNGIILFENFYDLYPDMNEEEKVESFKRINPIVVAYNRDKSLNKIL